MTTSSSKYRHQLPQLGTQRFLTDGGLETTLIFHDGLDLPEFAAFPLLRDREGLDRLKAYYESYIDIARRYGMGFILGSPTWRASPDWGHKLGYSDAALAAANKEAIEGLAALRQSQEQEISPIVISGDIGPRGDGYVTGKLMTPDEAKAYHLWQVGVFAETEVDFLTALTMTYANEAIGIALAAKEAGLPVVISFTVETDGRLPSGQALHEAIKQVDAATQSYPAYYMVNCAHPTHFEDRLNEAHKEWSRIRGLRANASRCSHAELDEADELDDGDPQEFGAEYAALSTKLPGLTILGGCCGTDQRHISEVAARCARAA